MLAPALAAALSLAAAAAGRTFAVDPSQSEVRYHVVHRLHRVEATSHRLEGKAVIQPGGRVLAMVRAPVASFESGDGNRDQHMQEVMETARFPFVVFKGVGQLPGGALPAGELPRTVELPLAGELELHGVKSATTVPVVMELLPDGGVLVRAELLVSLDAHRVERPSLLFVKVDDACRVEVELLLKEVAP